MTGTYSKLLGPKHAPVIAESSTGRDSSFNAGDNSTIAPQEKVSLIQKLPESPAEPKTAVIYDQQSEPEQLGRTEKRTDFRSENRSVPLSFKRRTKRFSYEFYEDQIFAIKKMVYEANMAGENISHSDIARQALDEFLEKQK